MSNEPAKRRQRGRPTKYRPEYCDAVIEHMRDGASLTSFAAPRCIQQARLIDVPIVYGLCDEDGVIFYVGKTIDPRRRFESYINPARCHNDALAARILKCDTLCAGVLEYSPIDLNAAETKWIVRLEHQLVNSMLPWIVAKSSARGAKAYSGGPSVKSPSAYARRMIATLGSKVPKDLTRRINSMSTLERCYYELWLYTHMPHDAKRAIREWRDNVMPNVIKYVQSHGS